jgi:hypothetical protein
LVKYQHNEMEVSKKMNEIFTKRIFKKYILSFTILVLLSFSLFPLAMPSAEASEATGSAGITILEPDLSTIPQADSPIPPVQEAPQGEAPLARVDPESEPEPEQEQDQETIIAQIPQHVAQREADAPPVPIAPFEYPSWILINLIPVFLGAALLVKFIITTVRKKREQEEEFNKFYYY